MMESKTFKVPNIGCDGCVRTIVNEIGSLAGVEQVTGNVDSKIVTVEWNPPANWAAIEAKLIEIEYAPELN